MKSKLTRRRFIGITAAAAGLELLPLRAVRSAPSQLVTWRGVALGAVATLQIHHPDRAAAERLVARSVDEIRRLERVFSLYRDDSILVALNRAGFLAAPPPEMVALLEETRRFARLTGGAFDATVQPLWTLYADHFSRPDADPAGPAAGALAAVLDKVGIARVSFDRDRIAFAHRGMALTFNGIAQGYLTDRVVALLRAEGIDHSLVDLGESRALGAKPDGRPWQIGIADPDVPGRTGERLPIVDRAVATSGGYGFRFDEAGRFTHLFDPRTGRSPARYRSVTVVSRTATAADALSTAFACMPIDEINRVLRELDQVDVRLMTESGQHMVLSD